MRRCCFAEYIETLPRNNKLFFLVVCTSGQTVSIPYARYILPLFYTVIAPHNRDLRSNITALFLSEQRFIYSDHAQGTISPNASTIPGTTDRQSKIKNPSQILLKIAIDNARPRRFFFIKQSSGCRNNVALRTMKSLK